jgi:hypothetical protein
MAENRDEKTAIGNAAESTDYAADDILIAEVTCRLVLHVYRWWRWKRALDNERAEHGRRVIRAFREWGRGG